MKRAVARAAAGPRRISAPRSAIPAWIPVVGVVLLALAVRLWAMRYQSWVTIDGTDYINSAEALASGHVTPTAFPPGYPALIAMMRVLIHDRVTAAAMVSVIAGSLLAWPVWLLARRAVGERWAIAPALAAALHPILVQYSSVTMSESAYLLALYGALAIAAGGRAVPAGLTIGAAYAIRPEALVPAAALAVRELRSGFRNAATWRSLAFAGGAFLVLAVPCWLFYHALLGEWTLTPKLRAFRVAGETWQEEEERFLRSATPAPRAEAEPMAKTAARVLQQVPGHAVAHGRSLIRLWPVPLLLLSLLGLARRRGIEAIPLLHLLVIPFMALSEQPRFVLSAVPSLAILAAVPFATTTRRLIAAGRSTLAALGIAWCLIANYREVILPIESYAGVQREAGEWLAGVASPGDPVMDRKPQLAFYAHLPYRVTPLAPYDTLLNFAVRSGVRYLVLEEGVVRVFRAQLQPLIYDPAFRDREGRLEMIYAGGHFKGYGVMIFRVLRPGEARSGRAPFFDVRWRTPGGELPPDARTN